MRLERASRKAVKYAIMNYHYSKAVPNVGIAYSVFEGGLFCGVICYRFGAANNIGKPFGLKNGQCIELLRVALNGRQKRTSKALSLSLSLLKKDAPLVSMVVSFADSEQKHIGTIYQATNWFFIGESKDTNIIVNGQRKHRRSLGSLYGTSSVRKLKEMGIKVDGKIKTQPKFKYIYPLDKKFIPMCKEMSKPYPKKTSA